MPLGKGVRYRAKTNKDGSKTRLAFKGDEVVETKDLSDPDAEAKPVKKRTSGENWAKMASEYKKKRGY